MICFGKILIYYSYGVKKNPKALCLGKREVVEGKLADCFSWQT